MKKIFGCLSLCVFSQLSFASISSCTNLYVGKVQQAKNIGLQRFTLVEHPNNSSGSCWISLAG